MPARGMMMQYGGWGVGGARSWSCAVGFDRLLARLKILTLGSYWEDWERMRLERRCLCTLCVYKDRVDGGTHEVVIYFNPSLFWNKPCRLNTLGSVF